MAKISNVNSDSGAPTRVTRRTRSQSAEPVETTRPASRGGRAAQKIEPASAPVRGKKREKKKPQKIVPDLTTVDEDAEREEELDNEGQHHGGLPGIDRDVEDIRRASALSAMSGTTAKTSFSQEEVDDMDGDIIMDSIPNLVTAFEDLARVLLPAGKSTPSHTWKEIRTPHSRLNKLYMNRLRAIDAYKPVFGSQLYIQPRIVLKALFGKKGAFALPTAPWRPDNILLKMNLIQMMRSLLIGQGAGQRTLDDIHALERLLTAFPHAIAGQEYSNASMEIYANIAAHVAISRLEDSVDTDPNFSPYQTIDGVFFDQDGAFIHTDALGLNDTTSVSHEHALKILADLAEELKKPFRNGNGVGATAAIGRLKLKFRWDALEEHALRYYESRYSQLTERVSQAGGISGILEALSSEIERRKLEEEAELLGQRYAVPKSTKRRSLGSLAKLKEREKLINENDDQEPPPHSTQQSTVVPTTVTEPQVGNDDEPFATSVAPVVTVEQPHSTGEDTTGHVTADVEPARTMPSQSTVRPSTESSTGQNFAAARNLQQRARWTDPQPGATRIDPNMDGDDVIPERKAPFGGRSNESIPGSSRARKRARVEEEVEGETFDPTQDEGFETDRRDRSFAAQRRQDLQSASAAYRPRPRQQSYDLAGPSNYASGTPGPSPPKRSRKNPGSSMPDPPPRVDHDGGEVTSTGMYEQAKYKAKMDRLGGAVKRPIQQRTPWSRAEEEALINLIEEHCELGISWANIKAIDQGSGDPVLNRRAAEDLRFKARNMKVTMVLSGSGLPDNWEHVQLGKKEIDKIHSRGIEYDQERQRAYAVNFDE